MLRRRIALSLAAVVTVASSIAGVATPVAAVPALASISPSTTGCTTPQLQLAPKLTRTPDLDPDGHPISISPGPKSMFVPVIVVHGWNGRSAHDDSRAGNFSGRIDLTANAAGTVSARTSLVGQLQDMAGSAVYTFDYHRWSDRWVTDPHIGGALATAIDCLYKASGQKVVIVAHSMGGLAVEQTFSPSILGAAQRAAEISTVVTLGTPFKGSVLSSLAHGAADATAAAGSLGGSSFLTLATAVLAACGRISTVDADSICTRINALTPVTTLESDAANALQYGSAAIRALPSMPKSIRLVQLAGDADYSMTASWFRQDEKASTVHLGDTIVTTGSAIPSPGREHAQVGCSYTLDPRRAASDRVGVVLGVVAKADARRVSVPIIDSSVPCGHGQLLRDIELTNDALAAVDEDISARVKAALKAAVQSITVPAGVCYDEPAALRNGAFVIPDTDGNGGITLFDSYYGDDASDPTSTVPAVLADGRSQMSNGDRGAIAVSLGCSASGAGGGYSYLAVYGNDLQPIGLIDPQELTTAEGAGLPGFSNTTFVGGRLRTDVGWLATTLDGTCPQTKVRLDYGLTRRARLQHGPVTTLEGDPACGARPASTDRSTAARSDSAVDLDGYRDATGVFDAEYGPVYSWDSPDHSVRCSTPVAAGVSDWPAVGCMVIAPTWRLPRTSGCGGTAWPGFSYGEGGISAGCGDSAIIRRGPRHEARVLSAGSTISVNGLDCRSGTDSMRCTFSVVDGGVQKVQGFTLSRSSYRVTPSYSIVR